MSFLDRISKAFKTIINKSATVPLQTGLKWLFSQIDKDEISQDNAYGKHVWVYVCINKIAGNIARIPVKQFSGEREILSGPSVQLLKKPNPFLTGNDLIRAIMIYKKMRGEVFLHLIKLNTKKIIEIEILEPEKMKPVIRDGVLLSWEYFKNGSKEIIPVEDIIQIKEYNPFDPVRGLSPLQAAMRSVKTDNAAQKFNDSVLKNGTFPGSVIETDDEMNDAIYKQFVERWRDKHKGVDKAGIPAVLTGGMKYKEIKLSHQEISWIEQREISKKEIHAIYDVPAALTGDVSSFNRANLGYIRKMFWSTELIPEMEYIQSVLNTQLFDVYYPNTRMKFDYSVITELDEEYKTKIEQAKSLFLMGVSFNEINQKLNLGFEEKKERDQMFVSGNVVPISMAGQRPNKPKSFEKSVDSFIATIDQKEKRKYEYWKAFVNRINSIEYKYKSKLSRFMFEIRQELLSNLYDGTKGHKQYTEQEILSILAFDLSKRKEEIIALSEPFFEDAMKKGWGIAVEELGTEMDFVWNQDTVDFLNGKKLEITGIVDTIKTQVDEKTKKIISEGLDEGLTLNQVAKNLDAELKHIMTMAGNRSKLIARTEIASCANGSKFLAFAEAGLETKTWINSYDSKVRQSHRINETVPFTQKFSNGLQYPGDPTASAKELCNCRCTISTKEL